MKRLWLLLLLLLPGLAVAQLGGADVSWNSTSIISLWTGTCNSTTFLRADGSCQAAGGGSGTVTTTGSPANGSLTKFSGTTSITNGDLSGDCTTSGALAITCTKTSGVSFSTSATTDTTNAANIASGVLVVARGGIGVGTLTGIAKGNGTSAFTAAVRVDMLVPFEPVNDLTGSLGIGQSGLLLTAGNTGTNNTGLGASTLAAITSGSGNTAAGFNAGLLTTGANNTLIGSTAGSAITSGGSNIVLGQAGNITTGSGNILVGNSLTGTTATVSNQLDIGDVIVATGINTPSSSKLNLYSVYVAGGGSSGGVLMSAAAPGISSGFGTSASVNHANGSTSFSINVGTGGSATSGVVSLPTAANGWSCFASDTGATPTGRTEPTAGTTTTITLTNYSRTTGVPVAWTASEVIQVGCLAN